MQYVRIPELSKRLGCVIAIIASKIVVFCAAQPESPGSGSCALKCNNRRVGSAQAGVVLLAQTNAINIACVMDGNSGNLTQPLNGPVQVRFLVFENRGPLTQLGGGSTQGGGGTGGGGAGGTGSLTGGSSLLGFPPEAEQGTDLTNYIPLAGIGFEPYVVGTTAAEKTQEGYDPTTGDVTPFKYAGVATPRSEWCTDSCGVATYEVWPLCIREQENPVTASIFVHGVAKPPAMTITVTHSKPES